MAQEPGSTQPLTPSEVEQAFASAPFKNKGPALLHASEERVNWKDSNGRPHRDGDLPAVVWDDGSQIWWQHGKHHRDDDLPAVVWKSGVQAWYQHGEEHRDGDLPSRVRPGGDREWRPKAWGLRPSSTANCTATTIFLR